MLDRNPEAKGEFHILVGFGGTAEIMGEDPCMRTHSFFLNFFDLLPIS